LPHDLVITDERQLRPARPQIAPIHLGTLVFLASETVFFAALFAAYFTLRSQTIHWPPSPIDVAEPALGTALLVASSGTFVRSLRLMRDGSRPGFRRWMVVTLSLGATFLALQLHDYSQADFSVSTDAYGTLFYAMTGFHGLHVVVGLLLMFVLLGRGVEGADLTERVSAAEAVGYYWHFVDVVWVALFVTLYLLR
jgi:cytochrome c oxidase subunit III